MAERERTDLGVLLALAYGGFVAELHAALAAEGYDDLRSSYGYVFRTLAERELSAAELGVRLGITSQGAAKLVDEMVARGYVERHPHASDRRVRLLRLAPRGQQALAAARRFHAAYEERLRRELGAARASALRRELEALAAAAEDAPGGPRLRPT